MDLFDVVSACFRRWYVALPLLLVTVWYSHDVYASAKPVYYANTVLGLAPPSVRQDVPSAGGEVRRNGLLDVGGATLLANLTAIGLQDPSVVGQVSAAGGLPDYVSKVFPTQAPNPQLPLVMIEATSPDPAAVSRTLGLVTAQADGTMRTIQQQARVPDDQMVTSFVVAPPSTPAPAMPSRTRSTITIFAVGVGLSVLCAVLADVLLPKRRRTPPSAPPRVVATDGGSPADSRGSAHRLERAAEGAKDSG